MRTFVVAGNAGAGKVLLCLLTAYTFARLTLKLKRCWLAVMPSAIMLPHNVTLVAQSVLFQRAQAGRAAMSTIIDADCHISSHKFDGLAITADELIHDMDRAGVGKALVWLKPPYTKDIGPENAAVYAATQRYPNRLLGFGWVNPRLGAAPAADTIRRCFEEYGFYGIKFNGAQDEYRIDDEAVLPLIEQAASYGKPLAFHIGSDAYENTHPYRLGRIAARFPETKLLMIHMGGASLPPLERAAIETAAEYANIMIIGSAIHEIAILEAIGRLGPRRVCFGSDAPFRLQHVQLAKYRALLRDLDETARHDILGSNIARLLGLPAVPEADRRQTT